MIEISMTFVLGKNALKQQKINKYLSAKYYLMQNLNSGSIKVFSFNYFKKNFELYYHLALPSWSIGERKR